MSWKKLLANLTSPIDEELRLRNEYLVTENRILRSKIEGQLRLKDEERRQLATIGRDSDKERLSLLRRSSSLIPLSVGMHDWWLASSMAPGIVELRDDHR